MKRNPFIALFTLAISSSLLFSEEKPPTHLKA